MIFKDYILIFEVFMKKNLFIAFLFLFSFGVFADVKESDLYYVSVRVVRAFHHSKGYYIVYRSKSNELAEVYIPYKWFKSDDGRAKLKNCSDRIDPYISLYTKNGEFDHINVALPIENRSDPVWGFLRSPQKYDEKFDIETIQFVY